MALKFRRGNNAQKSGSLAFGEPYVNTTLGTLQVGLDTGDVTLQVAGSGSVGTFGAITGTSLTISGDAEISGNLSLGGNITIGNQTSDTVVVSANLSSSLIPSDDNIFDLGSSNKKYRDVYVGRNITIDGNTRLGNDSDDTISFSGSVKSNIVPWTSSFIDDGAPQFDLGSRFQPWRHIYVSTGSIYYIGANGNAVATMSVGQSGLAFDNDVRLSGSLYGSSATSSIFMRGNAFFTGSVSASTFTGLGNLTQYSTSVDSRLKDLVAETTALEVFTASAAGRLNNLELDSASQDARLDLIETFTGSQNTKNSTLATYTGSVNDKFAAVQSSTASLNSFTASINTTIKDKLNVEAVLSGSAQVVAGLPTNTVSASSDTANVDITIASGVISADLKGGVVSGSAQVTSLLPTGTVSGSSQIDATATTNWTTGIKTQLNSNTVVSGSAQVTSLLPTGVVSGSSQLTTEFDTRYLNTNGDSVVSGSSQIDATQTTNWASGIKTQLDSNAVVSGSGQLTSLLPANVVSSSTDTANVDISINSGVISADLKGGVVSGSSQIDATQTTNWASGIKTQLNSNTVVSGSSQIDATQTTNWATGIKTQLDSNTVVSGSAQVVGILSSLNSYTQSNDTTNTNQNNRLNSLESYSSSLKTAITVAGSDVTVNGNLTVAGTTTAVNSTTVQIGDNIIELNGTGAANGGLRVKDPTAPNTVSGSLLWDSTNDYWIAGALGAESKVLLANGDGVISGSTQLAASLPANVVSASNDTANVDISINSGVISADLKGGVVSGSSQVTSLLPTGVVSGSSQIDATQTTNWASGIKTQLNSNTVVSGSSQVNFTQLSGVSTNIVSASNDTSNVDITITAGTISADLKGGVVSGSSQVTSLLPTGVISGSSQVNGTQIQNNTITIAGTATALGGTITLPTITGGSGIISGSSQLTATLPAGVVSASSDTATIDMTIDGGTISAVAIGGVVSGSSQIDATQTTNWASGIKTQLDSNTVISGSSQVTGITNGQLVNSAITIAGTSTALGSSISLGTITGGSGIISGSSQLTANLPTNTVSASQDSANVDITISSGVISADLKGGVVSGSSQVTALLPTGVISGSSQLTTEFDTRYLNTNGDSVVSGSSQINGTQIQNNTITIAGTSTALGGTITLPTITGGSGIISGAAQLTSTLPAGVVSSSAQVVNYNLFALTASANTFYGNQTVSGSLYVTQDLVVLGSSSIQNVSSSTLNIGTNLITVAVNQPSVRFGGLAVIDSGSSGGSGSFLYDSVEDEFIFVHRGDGTNITSSHFILGPETYNNLGNETYLTNNRLPKGTGKEHLVDGNITDTGTLITLGSNAVVNGTFYATGTTLVSGSAQISGTGITNNTITIAGTSTALGGAITLATITGGSGIISSSAQIAATLPTNVVSASTDTANVDITISSGVISADLKGGVVSGSSQVTSLLPTGTISGSSQVTGITNGQLVNSAITIAGTSTSLGGSITLATITGGSGIISGSSQLGTIYETTGRGIVSASTDTSTIDITLNNGSISAVAIGGIVSGAAQVTSLLPTGVVSGSSQVSYTGLSNIPTNIVSASTDTATIDMNISNGNISAVAIGGIVSGAAQITALGFITSPISATGSQTASSTLYSTTPVAGPGFNPNNSYSIFFGNMAGANATNANYSVFLGSQAGSGSTNGYFSNFFGYGAGSGATNAANSNFLGPQAGYKASDADNSNFFGNKAGESAINGEFSNYLGSFAGYLATDAGHSNFLGASAGQGALSASHSNFLGRNVGVDAINASYSTLMGYKVGQNGQSGLNGIGTNNIIIGTNLTLDEGRRDSINFGGIIFATGSYYSTTQQSSGSAGGKVGINVVTPTRNFEVSGSVAFPSLTNSAQSNIVGYDSATGQLYYQTATITNAISASYAGTASRIEGGTTNQLARWTSTNTLAGSAVTQVPTNNKIVVGQGVGSSSVVNSQFEIAGPGESPDINYLGFSVAYAADPLTQGMLVYPARNRIDSFTFQQGPSGSAPLDIYASYHGFYTAGSSYPTLKIHSSGLIISGASSNVYLEQMASATSNQPVVVYDGGQLKKSTLAVALQGSGVVSGSSQVTDILAPLNSYTASLKTAISVSGADVTLNGNLTVAGTTTTINSTTVAIGDNIIQLNGTGATNAGIVVRDATAANTTSGSLLWDTTNDKWIAGPLGSEDDVVLRTLGQTLTNKTISGASNTLSNIANASLTNSSITIAGTSVSLGSSITLATITGGSGIISGSSQVQASSITGDIALGTQTSGNYVGTITAGSGLSSTGATTGEGISHTLSIATGGVTNAMLANSSVTLNGTSVALGASATIPNLVSGSAQISGTGITNNTITIAGTSTALGGAITLATITGGSGIVSGSSQVTYASLSGIPAGIISSSATVYSGVSGDITIASNGVATIAANSVALGTDTTGNYMSDVSAGNAGIVISHTPGEGSTATISLVGGVVSGSAQIDVASTTGDIALGTRTSGNYVASLVAGTNITLTNNSGEGATPTIGLTNNAITIAGTSTSLGGTITLATITGGSGIVSSSATVYSGVSGDITIASNGVATIAANSVALGTDTTGNYMVDVSAGSGISITHTQGEGSTATITNSGVRSLSAGTGVTLGSTTGDNCSISIGQAVGTANSPTFAGLTINGSITATGDITAYYSSDKRFKNNIQIIPDALDKVRKLNGVTWDWNENVDDVMKQAPSTGLIAQEVQEVLPQVVKEREDGHLGLDYAKMMGLLVEAIKEQQLQIENLKLELTECKKQKGL